MLPTLAGVPCYAIDEAMCMPSKPKAIEKKKMKGGTYTTKRGGAEACPPQFKGVCCGGAKEWGIGSDPPRVALSHPGLTRCSPQHPRCETLTVPAVQVQP